MLGGHAPCNCHTCAETCRCFYTCSPHCICCTFCIFAGCSGEVAAFSWGALLTSGHSLVSLACSLALVGMCRLHGLYSAAPAPALLVDCCSCKALNINTWLNLGPISLTCFRRFLTEIQVIYNPGWPLVLQAALCYQ